MKPDTPARAKVWQQVEASKPRLSRDQALKVIEQLVEAEQRRLWPGAFGHVVHGIGSDSDFKAFCRLAAALEVVKAGEVKQLSLFEEAR